MLRIKKGIISIAVTEAIVRPLRPLTVMLFTAVNVF